MKLVATIFETTPERALAAIRDLTQDHDAIELRVDPFGDIDLRAVRAATTKPIIVTNRGGAPVDFAKAYEAGIDFVDVEFGFDPGPRRDRVVLSHHDYEGPSTAPFEKMLALGCAHTKLAVTPRNYDDNVRLLELIATAHPASGRSLAAGAERGALDGSEGLRRIGGVTVIGMGERGLYARILAPFLGSELQFVAANAERVAAPGQLTLDDALLIYGDRRLRAEKIFAIAGNPAAHSRSPMIHNPLFRKHGVAGAYTIASFETLAEIAEPFVRGERFAPAGLSVTAPFKVEAMRYATEIAPNARECGAANTLVRIGERIVADNTDVDGFMALIDRGGGAAALRKAAIVGAGGTAKAAAVALRRTGIAFTTYNRTPKEGALPLDALRQFEGDLIINTLPGGVDVSMPGIRCIHAAYGPGRPDGLALLQAQAVRQNQLFRELFSVSS